MDLPSRNMETYAKILRNRMKQTFCWCFSNLCSGPKAFQLCPKWLSMANPSGPYLATDVTSSAPLQPNVLSSQHIGTKMMASNQARH